MNQDDIDWKGGHVRFWAMGSIDLDLPSKDQEYLDEDLAIVEYPFGYVLDIGWYQGEFAVHIVNESTASVDCHPWFPPLFREACDEPDQLIPLINKAVDLVIQFLMGVKGSE